MCAGIVENGPLAQGGLSALGNELLKTVGVHEGMAPKVFGDHEADLASIAALNLKGLS